VYENPFLAARQFSRLLKAFGYQLLVGSRSSFERLRRNGEMVDLMQRFVEGRETVRGTVTQMGVTVTYPATLN